MSIRRWNVDLFCWFAQTNCRVFKLYKVYDSAHRLFSKNRRSNTGMKTYHTRAELWYDTCNIFSIKQKVNSNCVREINYKTGNSEWHKTKVHPLAPINPRRSPEYRHTLTALEYNPIVHLAKVVVLQEISQVGNTVRTVAKLQCVSESPMGLFMTKDSRLERRPAHIPRQ
jgi:hypothetical protein